MKENENFVKDDTCQEYEMETESVEKNEKCIDFDFKG